MGSVPFEELEIYHLAEKISDEVWRVVLSWDNFAKDTVGKQLVRAADSISSFQKWREEIKVLGRLFDSLRRTAMSTVTLQEAQAALADLIHGLSPGQVLTVTENDLPVARIVPVSAVVPQRLPRPRPAATGVPKAGRIPDLVMPDNFKEPLEDVREYMQ